MISTAPAFDHNSSVALDDLQIAAEIYVAFRRVADVRRQVTALGDTPPEWGLAERVAELERSALALEADLDEAAELGWPEGT